MTPPCAGAPTGHSARARLGRHHGGHQPHRVLRHRAVAAGLRRAIFASWAARLRLRAPAGDPARSPAPATPQSPAQLLQLPPRRKHWPPGG